MKKILLPLLLIQVASGFSQNLIRGPLLLSVDRGSSWENISSGLPDSVDVKTICSVDKVIYAGTDEGIFKTGTDWQWQRVGPAKAYVNSIKVWNDNIVVATYNDGILISEDGLNWKAMNKGLPAGEPVRALTTSMKTLIAGCDRGIYVLTNNQWQLALNNVQVNDFKNFGESLFVATNRGIFRTADGTHWTNVFKWYAISKIERYDEKLTALGYDGEVAISQKGNDWMDVTPFLRTQYTWKITPSSPVTLRPWWAKHMSIVFPWVTPFSLPVQMRTTMVFELPKGEIIVVEMMPGKGC